MSERFEHRDRSAYEYTLARELARRRARGCARVLYWTVGVVLGLLALGVCAIIGVVAG